jgi:hypothetical protein
MSLIVSEEPLGGVPVDLRSLGSVLDSARLQLCNQQFRFLLVEV